MTVPVTRRLVYWRYFIERWAVWGEGGGHGITGPRLRKLYVTIIADDDLWADVVLRHGDYSSPRRMKEKNLELYEHCLGNFWGMIHQMMVERQMLR